MESAGSKTGPSEGSSRVERNYGPPKRESDERSEAERDRDRILFSSAFRRLAGITQVAAPTELYPIHNRLTHSLKVAQIGRGLAVRLQNDYAKDKLDAAGGLDPTVVEAAGLAHDLGHPPFGHIAEHELNALVTHGTPVTLREDADAPEKRVHLTGLPDGFEGNAQSFRIVTRLSARFSDYPGLDLTRATLCAVLKYPWIRIRGDEEAGGRNPRKWGAYDSEKAELVWARGLDPEGGVVRSLEAGLMDWADDIAYAVHDLEDFYRAGLIPLDRLAKDASERDAFLTNEGKRQNQEKHDPTPEEEIREAFKRPMDLARFRGPYAGTREERALLRDFTSELINRYMGAIRLEGDGWGEESIMIEEGARQEVETLKGLTWYYVIESQSFASQRFGQRSVIRSLFEIFASAAYSTEEAEWRIFPAFFQEKLREVGSDGAKLRIVSDVIASMSEAQALETHQRLTGLSLGSALMRPAL